MRQIKCATGKMYLVAGDSVQLSRAEATLRRNLRFYFSYKALMGFFGLAFPALFDLYRQCGMHNGAIAYLQAIFAIVLAVLGLGGGYLADRLTRKTALLSGLLFHVIGDVAYGTGQSFSGLVFAEILLAVALALMNGADHALLYEWLLDAGRQDEHPKMRSYGLLVSYLVTALAGLLGVLLMRVDTRLPFYVSSGFSAAALLVATRLSEPHRAKARGRVNHLAQMRRIGHEAFGQPRLRWLLLFAGVMIACTQGGFPLNQAYYVEQGLPKVYFGVIIAVQNVFAALLVLGSAGIERRLGQCLSFIAVAATSSGMYLLLGCFPSVYMIGAVLLSVWVRGFSDVVFADYLNRSIGSEHRATINSIMGFISRTLYAVLLLPVGKIAVERTVAEAFVALGIVGALAGTSLLLCMPRPKSDDAERFEAGSLARAAPE